MTGPVSRKDIKTEIVIHEGMSYLSITDLLKEKKLIKSKLFYKIHVKLTNPKPLTQCDYILSTKMGIRGVVKELSQSCKTLTITIPEGRHLEQIAEIASNVTNNKKEDLMKIWNSEEFVRKVIDKYEFINDEIKKDGIRYPLEGYFFPSTYELANKNVTPEYIAYKMLDQLDVIYNKYKNDIKNSKYTFHEILTLASVVEYEAILDEDRPLIASVFYNRLSPANTQTNGLLQSCATTGYAINQHKLRYTDKDNQTDSPYNTYLYPGLPIGPGNSPGEKSIVATLKPANTEYYYFLANVCDPNNQKTEFFKTYSEHETRASKLFPCR